MLLLPFFILREAVGDVRETYGLHSTNSQVRNDLKNSSSDQIF